MKLTEYLNPNRNNLDILRLLAALAVIYGHAAAFISNPNTTDIIAWLLKFDYSGSLAVKFFFLVSGFLVTVSIINNPNLIDFCIRRLARIIPALFVCVVITALIVGPLLTELSLREYLSHSETWSYIYRNTTLWNLQWELPGVFTEHKTRAVNGSLWTLPMEIFCYLVVGFLFTFGMWRRRWLATIGLIFLIIASFFFAEYLPIIFKGDKSAPLLGCFAIGALFATYRDTIVLRWDVAFATVVMIAMVWNTPLKLLVFYTALLYVSLFITSRPFVVQKLRLPADPSYGIYIYGFVIQQTLVHLIPSQSVVFNQIVSMILAVIVGLLSWFYVEKPFIKLAKKIVSLFNVYSTASKEVSYKQMLSNNPQKSLMTHWKCCIDIDAGKLFLCLLGISWAVHFLVLNFIFPGYYTPLAFHHSDFYIPAAFAHSLSENHSFLGLLDWPRPAFMWFYKFTGFFGHAGSVAWIVFFVFVNTALTAFFIKKIIGLKADYKFFIIFALYAYILYSQPYFYTFYSQDIASQMSYFFLLSGSLLFYRLQSERFIYGIAALFSFSIIAFLFKETYILAIGFIYFIWFLFHLKKGWVLAITPGLAVFFAGVIALGLNLRANSVFVNPDAAAGSSYHMNFSPVSILLELLRYSKDGVTPLLFVGLLTLLVVLIKNRKDYALWFVGLICFATPLLAWLPNSLLPNHHYPGYSFNGLYVGFAVIFFVLVMNWHVKSHKVLVTAILSMVLLSPLTSVRKYEGSRNMWVLHMEGIQKNMLKSFSEASRNLKDSDFGTRILIRGISSPFHPFQFPESMRAFPYGERGHYYFLPIGDQSPRTGQTIDLVTYVNESMVETMRFDQEWIFDEKGEIVEIIKTDEET